MDSLYLYICIKYFYHIGQHSQRSRRLRTVAERTTKCLIPDDGLPPLSLPQSEAPGL